MLVFHSPQHALHAPEWYVADGTVRPCPDVPARATTLLQALESVHHDLRPINPTPTDTADLLPTLQSIHTPGYLEYLRTIHALWFAEFHCDVIPDTFPRRLGPPAQRPSKPAAQPGYYCFDMAAPITAGTWTAALASAHCARAAARALNESPAAYALCRPPGHHAGPDYCGGFCYLNNAALAAQSLLQSGHPRVALLDLDYHHGNGSQDIFYARNDVLFVSLHADPNTQYPYFWGFSDQQGEGPGLGYTHNFPLPRGTPESIWLQTLEQALQPIQQFAPSALVISLGLDISQHDTVGDFQLSPAAFSHIGHRLAQLHLPTAFIQEGGYSLPHLAPSLLPLISTFEHP